jgi:hypothetical protein
VRAIKIFYEIFPWKYFQDTVTGGVLSVRKMCIFSSFYPIERERERESYWINANKNNILMSVSGFFPHFPGPSFA